MLSFVASLFGCAHRRCTFPITMTKSGQLHSNEAATNSKTYVVCLDCGKELSYDWQQMKVVAPAKTKHDAVA
jgi:hypothetical protein